MSTSISEGKLGSDSFGIADRLQEAHPQQDSPLVEALDQAFQSG